MRKTALLLILAMLAAVLTSCGSVASAPAAAETETVKETEAPTEKYSGYIFDAFDTVITVTAYCADQESFDALMDTARSEFMRWHRMCDIYFSYPGLNDLRTVNENAGKEPVEVPPELMELLRFAGEMYALTDGKVNVAMGSVLKLWHDAREFANVMPEQARLPDMSALTEAAKHCDIDDLLLDGAAGTVLLRDSAMSLDVGAIAKGYGTERVCETLKKLGFDRFVINAGGNVRCCGDKPGGAPWVVGVTNPIPNESVSLGTVEVRDRSVVTSGAYQRFFTLDGRRYHHIIDGETLMPEERYLSVTVITGDSGYADAMSTALFNMDIDEGLRFVEAQDDLEAMWVLADGTQRFSANFQLND